MGGGRLKRTHDATRLTLSINVSSMLAALVQPVQPPPSLLPFGAWLPSSPPPPSCPFSSSSQHVDSGEISAAERISMERLAAKSDDEPDDC